MTTPESIANEQSKPGTFSLIERLQNRGMPEEDVAIYLDEKLGWDLMRLEEKAAGTHKKDELEAVEAKIATVQRKLDESKYVFTLRGMSNERYDELIDEAKASFPEEFEEVASPLTGQVTKTVIEDERRDALFNTLFLAESIARVTDPDGGVDDNITPEVVEFIKRLAPLDAIRRVTELAVKMRMAASWMDMVQDEDFSLRP